MTDRSRLLRTTVLDDGILLSLPPQCGRCVGGGEEEEEKRLGEGLWIIMRATAKVSHTAFRSSRSKSGRERGVSRVVEARPARHLLHRVLFVVRGSRLITSDERYDVPRLLHGVNPCRFCVSPQARRPSILQIATHLKPPVLQHLDLHGLLNRLSIPICVSIK